MIEEQAEVTAIDGRHAWVSCRSRVDCRRCAEGRGCGGGLIGRWLGDRLHEVRVGHDGGIEVGDCVVIGVDERALLYATVVVYGVPLAGMLAGALAGDRWLGGDLGALAGAGAGLAIGFTWMRAFSRKMRSRRLFEPTVLRRAVNAGSE